VRTTSSPLFFSVYPLRVFRSKKESPPFELLLRPFPLPLTIPLPFSLSTCYPSCSCHPPTTAPFDPLSRKHPPYDLLFQSPPQKAALYQLKFFFFFCFFRVIFPDPSVPSLQECFSEVSPSVFSYPLEILLHFLDNSVPHTTQVDWFFVSSF